MEIPTCCLAEKEKPKKFPTVGTYSNYYLSLYQSIQLFFIVVLLNFLILFSFLWFLARCYHETASTPSSPTSRLLLEYEMHLRNTLAKGMDAESYSLHTFEALLTQSMENLGKYEKPVYVR